MGRGHSRKFFKINNKSKEKIQIAHDLVYTRGFNAVVAPTIYKCMGATNRQTVIGTGAAVLLSIVMGPVMGYSIEAARDFTGLEPNDRVPHSLESLASTIHDAPKTVSNLILKFNSRLSKINSCLLGKPIKEFDKLKDYAKSLCKIELTKVPNKLKDYAAGVRGMKLRTKRTIAGALVVASIAAMAGIYAINPNIEEPTSPQQNSQLEQIVEIQK